MRAFTHKDPDGNGVNDTYGVSGDGFAYLAFLIGAFGATSSEYYMLNEDSTVTTNAISEDYKAALTYLRDIYAEGLVDPKMFTCTETQAQTKWGRGEMGIWSTWRNFSYDAYIMYDYATLQPTLWLTSSCLLWAKTVTPAGWPETWYLRQLVSATRLLKTKSRLR